MICSPLFTKIGNAAEFVGGIFIWQKALTLIVAYDIICAYNARGLGMKIELKKQPKKYMAECSQKDYDKINETLAKLEEEGPAALQGKLKKLQGREDEYRISIPPFRIIFRLDKVDKAIVITRIDTRGGVYKKG